MCISLVCIRLGIFGVLFFFKQKTAYELRISDWSSDVCSSDLLVRRYFRNARTMRNSGSGRLFLKGRAVRSGAVARYSAARCFEQNVAKICVMVIGRASGRARVGQNV